MRKSRSLCYAAAVVATAVFLVGPPAAHSEPQAPVNGADPDGYVIAQHPYSPVYEAPPGVIAGNAMVEAFDSVGSDGMPGRHVQMTWQSNEDIATADNVASMVHSYDGGFTFPSGISGDLGSEACPGHRRRHQQQPGQHGPPERDRAVLHR